MTSNNKQTKSAPSAPKRGRGGKHKNNKNEKKSRGGRGRRRKRYSSDGVQHSVAMMPAGLSYNNQAFENTRPTQVRDNRWGDGISLPFSQLITTIGATGAAAIYDPLIPIVTAGITGSAEVSSGVQDSTGSNVSGLLCHPSMLGGRFIAETQNWTRYRFRKLCASFVPYTGTSTAGAIIMHLNADPNKWPEVVESTGPEYRPSITNLSSARPMVEGPVWLEQNVCVYFKGQETWPCEINVLGAYSSLNDLGGLSYIREAYQYRLATLLDQQSDFAFTLGRLYLSGVIEFYQPAYGLVSGLGVIAAPTTALLSSTSIPSTSSWKRPVVIGSKLNLEKKMSDPDDPIIIPPMPILKRTSGVDNFNSRTQGTKLRSTDSS